MAKNNESSQRRQRRTEGAEDTWVPLVATHQDSDGQAYQHVVDYVHKDTGETRSEYGHNRATEKAKREIAKRKRR